MLGRVYLDGEADRRLAFELCDGRLVIRRGPQPRVAEVFKPFMESLRRATNYAGFYLPPLPPIGHGTSSHYGGTLPYGGPLLDVARSGRVAPGVYLADAATFPTLPAISPTFTIMANACRTAHEGLQD
jgi:choline dehydrogenase-like flavoprotein